MPRPIWKGFITFGLVNIPVILYPAEKKFDIQFKMVDSRDKSKIRYVRINENTGEEVHWEDVAKGYEYEDGNYVLLKNEDIKNIAGENSKTINIESFINKDSLAYIDYEKPYYLVPDKKGEKGYVILREVLNDTKKIGIAKVIIHTRQYLSAVIPYENAIMLILLRYHQEIRKPSEFELPTFNLKSYKISTKELDIAKQLVHSMTSKWKPDKYEDEFRVALHKWVEEKIRHPEKSKMKRTGITKKGTVIDFVSLLKKSLKEKNSKSKKETKAKILHHKKR